MPGELYVGGVGVARGYVGRSDLTADRFVPDPFATEPGRRLYRTGDLVRWRTGGTLEFLGRTDDQLKIRGHRIEPGEIESMLTTLPGVEQAIVTAMRIVDTAQLVAYVVSPDAERIDAAELRRRLAGALPAYMIPAFFVGLARLPLTGTGKVDRNRLPRPETAPARPTPPRDPREQAIADLWCELLRLEQVGIHDDFFHLGGHSLLATRLLSRIRARFDIELPVRAIFDNPTVAGLGAAVETAVRAQVAGLSDEELHAQLS
jgi:acyl carrier protein